MSQLPFFVRFVVVIAIFFFILYVGLYGLAVLNWRLNREKIGKPFRRFLREAGLFGAAIAHDRSFSGPFFGY